MNETNLERIRRLARSNNPAITTKVCKRCNIEQQKSVFLRNGKSRAYCPECFKTYSAERKKRHLAENPEAKEKHAKIYRRGSLMRKYGITETTYHNMLDAQGGCCAICKADTPGSKKKNFVVDHCHKTGRIRGLLCDRCNRGIGFLGDDHSTVSAAASYLERSLCAESQVKHSD